MLKPVIILSEANEASSGVLGAKTFWIDRGIYPVWSSFKTSDINSVAEKSDLFLMLAPEHGSDEYNTACYYLRDLCLEEEKRVYQIGNPKTNAYLKATIPSLFVEGCFLRSEQDIGDILTRIAGSEKVDMDKKGFVIICADTAYCRNLRIALNEHFNVVVTDGLLENMEPFLSDATCVLIGLDVKGDFLEMAKLRGLLAKAKKTADLHVILLADTRAQQGEVNKYLGKEGLCLNKETDFVKNAKYLVNRYAAYLGRQYMKPEE